MENASKALIMAASVLLGIMIISVGVALFNSFAGFSSSITSQIEKTKIAEFNNQFSKYYGQDDNGQHVKMRIHDVITFANLAQKNNIQYEVQEQTGNSDNSYYIQISLKIGSKVYQNLEKLQEDILTNFMKDNDIKENTIKYYYIRTIDYNISGRINYVEIQEIKE